MKLEDLKYGDYVQFTNKSGGRQIDKVVSIIGDGSVWTEEYEFRHDIEDLKFPDLTKEKTPLEMLQDYWQADDISEFDMSSADCIRFMREYARQSLKIASERALIRCTCHFDSKQASLSASHQNADYSYEIDKESILDIINQL